MTQGFKDEFETIKILIDSDTKTGSTDAFIIAFTKLEKQARRIFTYTVYQFPAFDLSHYIKILAVIASKRFLYFENFIKGFNGIYPETFESIVGSGKYTQFISTEFPRIQKLRNKILHGQPTGKKLPCRINLCHNQDVTSLLLFAGFLISVEHEMAGRSPKTGVLSGILSTFVKY